MIRGDSYCCPIVFSWRRTQTTEKHLLFVFHLIRLPLFLFCWYERSGDTSPHVRAAAVRCNVNAASL